MRLVVLISMLFISSNALPPPLDKFVGHDEGGEEPAASSSRKEPTLLMSQVEEDENRLLESQVEEDENQEKSAVEPTIEATTTEEPMTEKPYSAELATAVVETKKDDSDGVNLHFYLSNKEDGKTSSKKEKKKKIVIG